MLKLLAAFLKIFANIAEEIDKDISSHESKKNNPTGKSEAPSNSTVQIMVTNKMRMALRDLGYTKFQIDDLSSNPVEAANRIKNQQGPNG